MTRVPRIPLPPNSAGGGSGGGGPKVNKVGFFAAWTAAAIMVAYHMSSSRRQSLSERERQLLEQQQQQTNSVLQQYRYNRFKVQDVVQESRDIRRITVRAGALKANGGCAWPLISHVMVKDASMQVERPFTPISVKDVTSEPVNDEMREDEAATATTAASIVPKNKRSPEYVLEKIEEGNRRVECEIELLIKRYRASTVARYTHTLRPGDDIELRGPVLTIRDPSEPGDDNSAKPPRRSIGMVAGGTGITPMYRLIKHHLEERDDINRNDVRFSLIYAARTPEDLVLYDELVDLARKHPQRLNVTSVVEQQGSDASTMTESYIGRVDSTMISKHLPAPSRDTAILVSGPDGMINAVAGPLGRNLSQGPVGGILAQLGYTSEMVTKLI
ncbi:ferredoxin reductase-like protein [Ramicandelaber brevisporus]|nr:ferredoxin reductase-like protein [Ramicandelaber brevisporus]